MLLVVGGGWSLAQDQKEPLAPRVSEASQSFDFWMTAKLKESQKIFAGLASADFQAIAESAETLSTLNKIEGFVRKRSPDYSTQLRVFEFATAKIQQQAEKKNIEGVVLGFNQLTLSCVHCHEQLRDADVPQK